MYSRYGHGATPAVLPAGTDATLTDMAGGTDTPASSSAAAALRRLARLCLGGRRRS